MRLKTSFKLVTLLATTSLLLMNSIISCTPAEEAKKTIGLQLWSVREVMKENPQQTITAIGEMGYTFIEAAGYADGKFYGMEPEAFATLVEANSMQFLSSHAGKPVPTAENWDETMAWWDVCIEAHVKAGVSFIVQPFMDSIGYESLEGLQRYCDYFNAIGEKCNDNGIRFGYHNHDKEFNTINGQTIYDYLLQHTDADKVMFQLDLYWINEGGKEPVTYFNQYAGRFELWHIKDEKELGVSGRMDFETTYANAEISGMKYAIVEVEHYSFQPIESVRRCLEFIQAADYIP